MRFALEKIAAWLGGRRGAALVALAVAAALLALSNHQPPLSASLTWYGVYTTSDDTIVRDTNSWTGERIESTGITRPRVDGDRIAFAMGERFGFGFALSGPPKGRIVRLRWVRLFPPPGIRDFGEGEGRVREEQDLGFEIGKPDLFLGYRFDRPEDELPGTWTFQLWDGDRPLLEKSFLVAAPESPKP